MLEIFTFTAQAKRWSWNSPILSPLLQNEYFLFKKINLLKNLNQPGDWSASSYLPHIIFSTLICTESNDFSAQLCGTKNLIWHTRFPAISVDSSVEECLWTLWTFELKSNNTLHLFENFHLRFSKHYSWIEEKETICQISNNQKQDWGEVQIPTPFSQQNCFPQHIHSERNISFT